MCGRKFSPGVMYKMYFFIYVLGFWQSMFFIVMNVSAEVWHLSFVFMGIKSTIICFAHLWEHCIRKLTHTWNLDLLDGSLPWVQSSLHSGLMTGKLVEVKRIHQKDFERDVLPRRATLKHVQFKSTVYSSTLRENYRAVRITDLN